MSESSKGGPKAELHVHLGGCIGYGTCLEMLLACPDPKWTWYETHFEEAYGMPSEARSLVAQVAAGDEDARARFREVFEFGDGDGGQFSKFQAKFNLLLVGDMAFRCLREDVSVEDGLRALGPVIESIHRERQRQALDHVETRLFLGRASRDRGQPFIAGILEAYDDLPGSPNTELIVSLDRGDPLTLWQGVKELALGPTGHRLVGVDFCNVEEGFPPKGLSAFFDDFNAFNREHPERRLALVYHVGESYDDKSLESAVRWVVEAALAGAHRLGHAIALGIHPNHYGPHSRTELVSERRDQIAYDLSHKADLRAYGVPVDETALATELQTLSGRADDDCIEISYDERRLLEFGHRQRLGADQIRATQAIIEVCPSSNRRIAGIRNDEHHPIHRFAEWNLPFIICSDDPGLFGVTLDDELETARLMLNWKPEEMSPLIERAWSHRSVLASGREQS
jgi:hypothetical protein